MGTSYGVGMAVEVRDALERSTRGTAEALAQMSTVVQALGEPARAATNRDVGHGPRVVNRLPRLPELTFPTAPDASLPFSVSLAQWLPADVLVADGEVAEYYAELKYEGIGNCPELTVMRYTTWRGEPRKPDPIIDTYAVGEIAEFEFLGRLILATVEKLRGTAAKYGLTLQVSDPCDVSAPLEELADVGDAKLARERSEEGKVDAL